MDIEQIKQDIKRLGLDRRTRKVEVFYPRVYLSKWLWSAGVTQEKIAELFNMSNHSATNNAIHKFDSLWRKKYFQSCIVEVVELYPMDSNEPWRGYLAPVGVYKNDFRRIKSMREVGQKKADVIRMLINHYENTRIICGK